MKTAQLVAYIKSQGCAVRMYRRPELKMNRAYGTFGVDKNGKPCIDIAALNSSETIRRVLLHEFGHYLQWKTGFMQTVDGIIDGWTIYHQWIKGKAVRKKQLVMAARAVCVLEYDAELRALEIGRKLGIRLKEKTILNIAHSYVSSIKAAFSSRQTLDWCTMNMHKRVLSPTEVVANLTGRERRKALK